MKSLLDELNIDHINLVGFSLGGAVALDFTIRYSQTVEDAYYESANSNRDMLVKFRNKVYTVQYLNNVDEGNVELEMQCKEVMK